MSDETNIEWTSWQDEYGVKHPGYTWNPWRGCAEVPGRPGCAHCYARQLIDNGRLRGLHIRWIRENGHPDYPSDGRLWGPGAPRVRGSEEIRNRPARWQAKAAHMFKRWRDARTLGHSVNRPDRPRVFCGSLMDWLDGEVPTEWRLDIFRAIRACPDLTFILVSKREGLFRERLLEGRQKFNHLQETDHADLLGEWVEGRPPKNVWLVSSVEDQRSLATVAQTLPDLPAVVRGLSIEPLLAGIDPSRVDDADGNVIDLVHGTIAVEGRGQCVPKWARGRGIDWAIIGGESGEKARPFPVLEAWDIVLKLQEAKVPVFFKQMGKRPYTGNFNANEWPAGTVTKVAPNSPEAAGCFIVPRHPKGGDPAEWPDCFGQRQFPPDTE